MKVLQGCADVGAIDGEMPRVKGGRLPLRVSDLPQVAAADCMPAEDSNRDPRVYLAAERTFLAWIRTSLALMAFGFVVSRFGLFLRVLESSSGQRVSEPSELSLPLGVFQVLLGMIVDIFAAWRHVRYVRAIDQGLPTTTTFDACGRARCDSCSARVGDGVLSGNYDEVTPCAAQYTEQGAHFQARARESMRYLRTRPGEAVWLLSCRNFSVISRVFKSITAT